MNLFVANVGNRDLAFNVGTPSGPRFLTFSRQDQEGAREVQEALGCEPGMRPVIRGLAALYPGEARRTLLSLLRFPILRPALRTALAEAGALDRILLIGTDQDAGEAGGHYQWDTIEAAELLRELLPLEPSLGPALSGCAIEVLRIEHFPQQFEHAYQYLDRCLAPYAEPGSRLYASVNGGIPALNAALRIHALQLFGPRARLIETNEPASDEEKRRGDEGQAHVANSWPYRRDTLLRIIRDLLAAYEYNGALKVLHRELSAEERQRFQKAFVLLHHAAARFIMDFARARDVLAEARQEGVLEEAERDQYARTLSTPHAPQRLYELYWTALILLAREDYSNFVVRVVMLIETSRRQLVYLLTGVDVEARVTRARLDASLADLLEAKGYDDSRGAFTVDKGFFRHAVLWGKGQLSDKAAREAAEVAKRQSMDNPVLKKIETLRNLFIHRSAGVSQDELRAKVSRDFATVIPREMKQLLKAMGALHRQLGGAHDPDAPLYEPLHRDVLDTLGTG